jgi:uncharacterized protein
MNRVGYKEIEIKLPVNYHDKEPDRIITKKLKINKFHYEILRKSLDARNSRDIFWLLKIAVYSKELMNKLLENEPELKIDFRKRTDKVVVIGSGPAGFFSAYVLALSGFKVTLLERGTEVDERHSQINEFERIGKFFSESNYAYGEGGAGTFSDGKLTSRTKTISTEKKFIFKTYVENGAPEEIKYLSKPHIGSDNLRLVIANLRKALLNLGADVRFRQNVSGLNIKNGNVCSVTTADNEFDCDHLIVATGHSSYDSYRMLMSNGIAFVNKSFAIGVRVELPQEIVNISQWGVPYLKGLKAADYKLVWNDNNFLPVYSFCMCPGGKVVPATPAFGYNIVNGVSDYARSGEFANSGIVAGFNISEHMGREIRPMESLDWMEQLESKAFELNHGFDAPFNSIRDFLDNRISSIIPYSSYPFGLIPVDFNDFLPSNVVNSLREGIRYFSLKLKGFDSGNMIGIETKTSSPIRVVRDNTGRCEGFSNIYFTGEGSGYAGGIISSAADGVKTAIHIANL